MDKIKYEIIFKSGKVKNIVSKDINKVKNYITESFDDIESVKSLNEDTVKSKGYTVAIFERETEFGRRLLLETEIFKDVESAKDYAMERLEYYDSRKYFAYIWNTIIPEEKRQHADDILNWTPLLLAEYNNKIVSFFMM